MAKELKDTLNLPKTQFPMRANLAIREAERVVNWEEQDLYQKRQEKNEKGESFILHDGPPFTNGDVHIGTALNKILKDTIVRFKSMQGYRSPYLPGWDCHGLPIEHKVVRELKDKKQEMSQAEIRKSCAQFSEKFIEIQRKQFKRLGVLADWDREYKTKNAEYESVIIETFAKFVEKDLVYRSKKPVYWSIPCGTALAEAEVEYQDHVSPSIFVKFPVNEGGDFTMPGKTNFVIWTTTPWTIPANMAVAVHPRLDYVEVLHNDEAFIITETLVDAFVEKCKFENITIGKSFKGKDLEGIITNHPIVDRKSPVVLADYVTAETGTGCVHTAPGHGLDDYITGLNNNLEVYCPLDDAGKYIDDGQMPESLVGVSVLETKGKCPANKAVIELLSASGCLLSVEKYKHSYPHCWRSKTPVIFRAMDQWFVSLDKGDIRKHVLDAIKEVKWVPDWGQKRINGSVKSRPDWCISRQRSWGVPIPVFYDEDKNPLLDVSVILGIAEKVKEHGTNIWFEQSEEELLEGIKLPTGWEGKKLIKGLDTLDVWIDSGCSHRAVLQQHDDLSWPADVYLEGSDQHRGWFQSSLWTGLIADGKPPYKSIITHGFVVGQDGKKVSKSEGKPQTADNFVKRFGADVVRLWICSEDYRNDIPLSDEIFKHVAQSYRTIRNTLRFQIGSLNDFNADKDIVSAENIDALDQWALWQTDKLVNDVTVAYENFEFHKIYQMVNLFCGTTLSAIYHDILKDRLYTLSTSDPLRRSSQTAISHIFKTLTRLLAPIIPFTTDEAWAYFLGDKDFSEDPIYLSDWPSTAGENYSVDVCQEVDRLFSFKAETVNDKLEQLRKDKIIGQSLDAAITIAGSEKDELYKILKKYESSLPELFIVSQVGFQSDEAVTPINVVAQHADGERCPRSWRWVPSLVNAGEWGEVSPRCMEVLKNL